MDQEYLRAASHIVRLTLEGKIGWNETSFEYQIDDVGLLIWNVSGAMRALTARGPHFPMTIPLDYMALIVENYDFDQGKVETVDHTIPGIAAVFWNPLERRGEYAVIDGTHRIKKALGLGVEFTVLPLTAAESYNNLVWAPDAVWAGEPVLVAWEKEGPIGIEGVTP